MLRSLSLRRICLSALSIALATIVVERTALGQRQGDDDPPELHAVWHGVQGIDAFVKSGGKFTGQKNAYGQTAAMLAAIRGDPEIFAAFLKAGGKLTEEKDRSGRTVAMYVVNNNSGPGSVDRTKGPDYVARCKVIEIFSKAGGRFTDDQAVDGRTAAMDAVSNPQVIAAFVKAGGHFTNQQDNSGNTAAMNAVSFGTETLKAYARAGGKFTSQTNVFGETAEDIAISAAQTAVIAAQRGARPDPVRGEATLIAYRAAVAQQGGLIYISTDDEFTALKSPRAIEAFVKSGKHFDNTPDKDGNTAAMLAIEKGPKTLAAFVAFGGKFTNQLNKKGESAATIAAGNNFYAGKGVLDIYNAAIKKQGGPIAVTPVDEYQAVKMGPTGIAQFVKAGGIFTDTPNQDDLTSAMLAAAAAPEVIAAYAKAGGCFTDKQNKLGYTAAMVAVLNSPEAIRAFAHAGGHFSELQDHHGRTAAMFAASRQDNYFPDAHMELKFSGSQMKGGLVNEGDSAIQAFAEAGGRFTDQQDQSGRTSAMQAIFNGPSAIRAFARAGGQFSDVKDSSGKPAAYWAVTQGDAAITAFMQARGKFSDRDRFSGMTYEMLIASGDADAITAYSKGGGVFTDRKTSTGLTSADFVGTSYKALLRCDLGLGNDSKADVKNPEWCQMLLKMRGDESRARDAAAARAFQEAITRQGGIRHVQ